MPINHKIVELHGGKIWCESKIGEGTSFLFTLPKAHAAAERKPTTVTQLAPSVQVADAPERLARILLVDDNEADIELNRLMLIEDSRLHCDVLTASDGREALARMSEAAEAGNPIDVIVLDINMLVMSGFELLAVMQTRQMLEQTLVIMCSTSAYDMDRAHGGDTWGVGLPHQAAAI